MKHSNKTLLAIILSVSSLAAFAGNDGKMYTGHNCNIENDTSGLSYNKWNGSVSNTKTGTYETRYVVCPIVKDKVTSTQFAAAHVYVRNQNPLISMTCKLTSLDDNLNSSTPAKVYQKTKYSSTYWGKLNFGSGTVHSRGELFIRCNIPPKYNGKESSVANYYFEEK